jgi:GTPase SAR1 family protein
MSLLADRHDGAFMIGVVGPTRVGKTSLISAILRDSQDLLAGTSVEVQPVDTATAGRLSLYRRALNGSLAAGQFVPDAMKTTQEPFVFLLNMFAGDRESGLKMAILDYPGGWLDPTLRPETRESDWQDCREFMSRSTVLIVPIDAAVVMEAAEPRELAAVPAILTTDDVVEVARSWATRRNEVHDHEPGLLVLAPLKCESYFADNGGLRDESEALEHAVRQTYGDLIRTVRKEAPQVRIMYSPVDTIGCVELVSADWHASPDNGHDLEFNAKYRVRHPREQKIKGADAPLIVVCRHVAEVRHKIEEMEARHAVNAAVSARLYAERNEGMFQNMWLRLNGERRRRETSASTRSREAELAQRRVLEFEQVIEELARRPMDARVVEMAP